MSDLSFKSSRSKPKGDMGKWAEGKARDWLDSRSVSELGFSFHRYADAKAARGALAPQPADFLVARRGVVDGKVYKGTWHLEVKETADIRRLSKAKISQYGMLRKYNFAGITPYVLVYRSLCKDWFVFTPNDLFVHEDCPPSFPFDNRPTFATAADALETLFV